MKGQSQQSLRPCLSEGGLQTSSIFSAWKLKRHNIRSHPSPAESESRSPEIAVARERGKQHRGPAQSPAGPGPGGAALCSRVFLRDQHWFPCSCLTVVTLVPFAVDIKPRSGCTGLSRPQPDGSWHFAVTRAPGERPTQRAFLWGKHPETRRGEKETPKPHLPSRARGPGSSSLVLSAEGARRPLAASPGHWGTQRQAPQGGSIEGTLGGQGRRGG